MVQERFEEVRANLCLNLVQAPAGTAVGHTVETKTGESCMLQTAGISGCITGVPARAGVLRGLVSGIWNFERSVTKWRGTF